MLILIIITIIITTVVVKKKSGRECERNKTQKKQLMHKEIPHHSLTSAWISSKQ